jgi:hypothetical protein
MPIGTLGGDKEETCLSRRRGSHDGFAAPDAWAKFGRISAACGAGVVRLPMIGTISANGQIPSFFNDSSQYQGWQSVLYLQTNPVHD